MDAVSVTTAYGPEYEGHVFGQGLTVVGADLAGNFNVSIGIVATRRCDESSLKTVSWATGMRP